MTEIICAGLTGIFTIIVALIAAGGRKRDKRDAERDARTEARAEQRANEGRLQMAMIEANSKLVVGVAMALKRGHCNGEVEAGLSAVQKTTAEYEKFLEGIAYDHLGKA